jgi:hypothetical protein
MIKQRRQRIRYVMIGYDGDLIGNAENMIPGQQGAGFCQHAHRSSTECR